MGQNWIRAGLVCSACPAGLLGPLGCEKPAQSAQVPAPASTGPTVERGKYLVAITACNDCHTPFKLGEHGPEPDMSRMLSGHPELMTMPPAPTLVEGPWLMTGGATNTAWAGPWGVSYTANLTPDPKTGLGTWTEEMFIAAMRTGKQMGNGRPILPPMPWSWYGKMTDDDLKSIFMYLKTIPPIDNAVPPPILAPMPGK
jgi:hypothetical protein